MPNKRNVLVWDIETTPQISLHYGNWGQNIAPIQTLETKKLICFGAKWVEGEQKGNYVFKSAFPNLIFSQQTGVLEFHQNEKEYMEMLKTIHGMLSEAHAVVSWNGQRFDTRMLNMFFLLAGLPEVKGFIQTDLLLVARQKFSFPSNKLNSVAEQLGLGSKVDLGGLNTWKLACGINPKTSNKPFQLQVQEARWDVEKYQKQDVLLTEKVYKKLLPWIPENKVANANLFEPAQTDGEPVCQKCGSKNVFKNGVALTSKTKYQRLRCRKCGSQTKGEILWRAEI